MKSGCTEDRLVDKQIREGLRILAKIIARDFMTKSKLDGDSKNGSAENEQSQYKRSFFNAVNQNIRVKNRHIINDKVAE